MTYEIIHGDCLDVLRGMDDASVDSVVCDPPYGLSFMGKKWDYDVPTVDVWAECLRVLKPGGHLLAFAGTRTQHRMAVRIEDAGFEIRDCIMYVYGSGFPKSKNIGCKCRGGTVPYAHETTSQDLPDMRGRVDPGKPLPSGKEQDVLDAVQVQIAIEGQEREPAAAKKDGVDDVDMSGVQEGVHPPERVATQSEESCLLETLQREAAGDGAGGEQVRPDGDEVPRNGTKRSEQSSVEGGSDVLAQARELQADQVRAMPSGIRCDGQKGRVCDGAPSNHGTDQGASAHAAGGGSPHKPRPSRQQAGEPGAIQQQQGAQAGRACPTCGGIIGYEGYGTALKLAYEPIWLARKPLIGTVAENVTRYGTGALNVDGCRVGTESIVTHGRSDALHGMSASIGCKWSGKVDASPRVGRWPANLIHDGSEEVVDAFPVTASPSGFSYRHGGENRAMAGGNTERGISPNGHGDFGSAARFFYCAKADRTDREDGLAGTERKACQSTRWSGEGMPLRQDGTQRKMPHARNHHPTVKPTDLMRYLCRLITPPGGLVLDPFAGSGSTGRGAVLEGFRFIGIEREADYCEIARKRIAAAAAQGDLFHEVTR